MTTAQGISIAVLTTDQDDVELVNRTLRDAGHAAHCHWISQPDDFNNTMGEHVLELVIHNRDKYPDSIRQVVKQKDVYLPEVPLIAMQKDVDEALILQAMEDGACDLVSINNMSRLKVVVNRELRAFRVERALNSTLTSATEYRRQLQDYMQGSTSAIANIQEGIVTEANQAWADLFKLKSVDEASGTPLMDNFIEHSQAAVKGAIIATTKGKWQVDEKLFAQSGVRGREPLDLELEFRLVEFDDGPHVQIRIAPPEKEPEEPTKLVHEALKRDPTTLFFHRAQFIERMTRRLARKPKSGLQAVAYIKIDDFSEVRKQVGHIGSEEIIGLFAEEVRKRLHPRDVAGRFEGTVLMAVLQRGNERDAEVWGRQLVEHMQGVTFKVGEQEVNLTCTVGVCAVSGVYSTLDELLAAVATAHAQGKLQGGNCAHLNESEEEDTRMRKYDAIWVKRIKSALTDNRFRLAQLPIAGLRSDSVQMYDMLIRMLDEQNSPILPSEFLPAAERNNLMKTIDRWMITAAIDYCGEHDVDRALVRVSRHSILDPSLVEWMTKEFEERKVNPAALCIQIPEQEAAKFIKPVKETADGLREIGVAFALEHYGIDKNRFQILDILKPNYIKIDGELMHTLMTDTELQASVQGVASAAEQRGIETIAERVENANAMAVLFQLGIHFMQGHYVHEPEVVLQEAVSAVQTTLEAITGT